MSGVIIMSDKNKILYIRCSEEVYRKFRVMFAYSGVKNYEEFLSRLLDIYDVLSNRYDEKKIDVILDYLNGRAIIVR